MTPATILEHDGNSQPILEWALDYGITPAIIVARLERGMTVADAITMPMKVGHRGQRLPIFSRKQVWVTARKTKFSRRPPRSNAKTYSHNGKTLTLHEWSVRTGIKAKTLAARLQARWPIDRALNTSLARCGRRPGVPSDFMPVEGTGAGSTVQETPNITFSGKVENA